MRSLYLFLLVVVVTLITACRADDDLQNPIASPAVDPLELQDLGPAPELENEVWLNTKTSLRLADLRGKVVLLDMWTYG